MRSPTRCALAAALAFVAHAPAIGAQNVAPPPPNFRVTLLGTGSPMLSDTRFGPSILVEAGDQNLVFDAGRGAAQRLDQLGVSFGRINAIFLTHLHSDHVVGLPDLWLSGWILGRRTVPWELIGPAGTAAMAAHLQQAFAFDIDIRVRDGGQNAAGARLAARDVGPGVVYERDGVKVTAFLVDHAMVKPAFGYRIDYGGRSVVLSGDTRFSPNLIAVARGADLLVHEVVLAPADVGPSAPYYRAFAHHTTPEQAADVFTRARPTLAVYSHIVIFGGSEEAEIMSRTRRSYAGPVLLGHDLMSVAVGDTVATSRPRPVLVAQRATADAENPIGVWRGTSLCLVRASPCHDEVVVYRITRLNAGDSISMDARKIVNAREEEMGVLACRLAALGASVTCTMPNGVWHFAVRGDSLVGELRLPDSTKFRDVRAARSR